MTACKSHSGISRLLSRLIFNLVSLQICKTCSQCMLSPRVDRILQSSSCSLLPPIMFDMFDIDNLTVVGRPSDVLPTISPVCFSLGRAHTKNVKTNHTLICTGPFYVQISSNFKFGLAAKIDDSFGYPLTVSNNPLLLHNFASRRIGTNDLVAWLDELGCTEVIATQFAFKSSADSISPIVSSLLAKGCSLTIDVGHEFVPSISPTNYVPLVMPVAHFADMWPQHKKTVHNMCIPIQSQITGRTNMLGGVEFNRRSSSDHIIEKVIVYQKTTHFWKAACESNVVDIPKNFASLRNSKKYMTDIMNFLERMGDKTQILRFEFRIRVANTFAETLQQIQQVFVPLTLSSLIIYELPMVLVVPLGRQMLVSLDGHFSGKRDSKELDGFDKLLYCLMMSTLGVSNGKFNTVLFNGSNLGIVQQFMAAGNTPLMDDRHVDFMKSSASHGAPMHIVDKYFRYKSFMEALPPPLYDTLIPVPQYPNEVLGDAGQVEDTVIEEAADELTEAEAAQALAESQLRLAMEARVKVFQWRDGVRACTKNGGTARSAPTVDLLIGRLMEAYGENFEDYLVCVEPVVLPPVPEPIVEEVIPEPPPVVEQVVTARRTIVPETPPDLTTLAALAHEPTSELVPARLTYNEFSSDEESKRASEDRRNRARSSRLVTGRRIPSFTGVPTMTPGSGRLRSSAELARFSTQERRTRRRLQEDSPEGGM